MEEQTLKKVFIKYNPYKLETEITVDGKSLAQNSMLGDMSVDGARLQEWIEELPQILIDEYNDTEFEVIFHGTLLDFEDLSAVFEAYDRKMITAKLSRIPAKETIDKEILLDDIFNEISNGPFTELRDEEIKSAFEHAKSSDFEVCVVATMSAGKSTLINAMLGAKLMPSKQEACTAIITRIKDTAKEGTPFRAEVFNHENELMGTYERLTHTVMERLNSDEEVSLIHATGDIPFVSAEDVSLVLIDTPGPNNSRDRRHIKVQKQLLDKSSKALILYVLTGEFGTDDDNALLNRVAESMSVGGKQSKDRFIFVVNKMDDRKPEDGDTEQTLSKVRAYLKTHGINNPNLFPASALPALNIRLIESGANIDEETFDDTDVKVRKLNRKVRKDVTGKLLQPLHFEKYATLPPSIRRDIDEKLEAAKTQWSGNELDNPYEALIHTGVISIEAAIRQYVQKYAKTAKIKNIVDTFTHKLDEAGYFENMKVEVVLNNEKVEGIVRAIELINEKINSTKEAMVFKNKVDNLLKMTNEDSINVVEEIIQKFQKNITLHIDSLRLKHLAIEEAMLEVEEMTKFAKDLELDFETELTNLINSKVVDTYNKLAQEYLNKLTSLAIDLENSNISSFDISPLKLMKGTISLTTFSIKNHEKEKEVVTGKEWVKNTDKKWYKPWTWKDEKGYYRKVYETVKYVNGSEIAREFFRPIETSLLNNADSARKYASKQTIIISENFNEEMKRLDNILLSKLDLLKEYATDKEAAEVLVRESEAKLKWLETINNKLELVLEV